ncbi:MAG TPA: carbamate kinase [Fastidiosipila sp.]|nr:carbamate kinase [Fastidiosipila sp.]
MKAKRILISLGGNALGTDPVPLVETARTVAEPLAELISNGYEVVLCHGNGPQVGMIKVGLDGGRTPEGKTPVPMADCVAMSQSYMGHHIQNQLENELRRKGSDKTVVTVVSRCLVDPEDPGFSNPTKPIGAFLSEEEGRKLAALGKTVVEDSGRGYREVVASPIPLSIMEEKSIAALVDAGQIVIAGGGGGIPVVDRDGQIEPIDAVIDKDWVSVLLASAVNADALVILTGVEKVAIGYNTPGQAWLSEITTEEAKDYIKAGEFPPGSMLPKIQAALKFVESGDDRKTLITSLDRLVEGLAGETGTWIVS